jgi:Flp pilus assembly protein TadD
MLAGLLVMLLAVSAAQGAELRVTIPKRSKPTPVQQLNQEGVKALENKDIAHAKRAFYRAYLLDPDDPFTLNNLGYVAELDGELDKAQKFYDLSAASGSNAAIAFSSNPQLEGKKVSQVAGSALSASMQVNRLNIDAMGLLAKERAPEAEVELRKALALDPRNPFTMNNLGYALEKEGELEQAVNCYTMAAASRSDEKVVVAFNRSWRGRPITEIANTNAKAARRELSAEGSTEAKVTRLNLRGVSALNRNQPVLAREYFRQAYKLDPDNAFSLNNMGYMAEVDGDRETADEYYAKARGAERNSSRVTLATRKNIEGLKLAWVADENRESVEAAQEKQLAVLRAQGFPPLPLRTRDKSIVSEPATPPVPEPETPVRIVAEDNPPPEPPAMAAPARRSGAVQPNATLNAVPARTATPDVQFAPSRVQPEPQAVAPAPAPAPVPTMQTAPEDETPLLPVIPDEYPSRR